MTASSSLMAIFAGVCIFLPFFTFIVIVSNYGFKRLFGRKRILIPVILNLLFCMYYAKCRDYSMEVNALAYLFAAHLPFVAISFSRLLLKTRTTRLCVEQLVFAGSILLYIIAIGDAIRVLL